jgi:prephenate dehydratase
MKIAIQGGQTSFHHIAANKFFDHEVEIVEEATFDGLCQTIDSGDVDFGLMAIENSIAGTILLNYKLIEEFGLKIVGEYKLRIKQNLMALPGQKLEGLNKVRSHYMALSQCKQYLRSQDQLEQVEYYDTADAAKLIFETKELGAAAIASEMAAKKYGLEIYAEEIETIKQNYTRFFVLAKDSKNYPVKQKNNKSTISFRLKHEVGSLATALQEVVKNNINLTKIQSVPIIGKPDEYTFYIDCLWTDIQDLKRCLVGMRSSIDEMTILGEYKNMEVEL